MYLTKRSSSVPQTAAALTQRERIRLAEAHHLALESADRIAIDSGLPERLFQSFCDSPWLDSGNRVETLCDLLFLFEELKNRIDDRIPDEVLLRRMRQLFDDPCRGSVLLLTDCFEGGIG